MQQLVNTQRYRLQATDLLNFLPPVPRFIEETGLPYGLIQDLVLRRLFLSGQISGLELARSLHLPYSGVVEAVLDRLLRDQLVDFTGGQGYGRAYFDYVLTEKGRERARDALERCAYVGPAPVSLTAYTAMIRRQMRDVPRVGQRELDRAFHDMVLEPAFFERLGPAVNSVRSLFLYGPSGNGKTSIAERIATLLRGEIFVPFAVEVDSQIIQIYDPLVHRRVLPLAAPPPRPAVTDDMERLEATLVGDASLEELTEMEELEGIEEGQTVEVALPRIAQRKEVREDTDGGGGRVLEVPSFDPRWVLSYRPRIIVGGELTLEDLELTYNATGKFYEAPHQVKACAGMLLIDDFGRQKVHPTDLLNRWIVPLEKRIDYLTLKTGKKFELPFDLLIIFSPNIDPSKPEDEADLRRIRYKLEVCDPSEEVFRSIFQREAERQGVRFDKNVLEGLIARYYRKTGRPLRGCHPRDILQLVQDHARFQGCDTTMTRKLVEQSCDSYFVHMEGDSARRSSPSPLVESLLNA